jgi:hypothetical protein
MTLSLQQSRLGVNLVLTHLAQGVIQPEFVMRLLYPLAETADYGGQAIVFDDSVYEETQDDRADDTPYPEIQDSFYGQPYKLNTKGLMYRVGDKKANQMNRLGINWGNRASARLMSAAGLNHEIQAAAAATNVASYATTNRITLAPGVQFNDAATDPDLVIRAGKSAVSSQIGVDPNVCLMGQDVFDTLSVRYARAFTAPSPSGMMNLLTEEMLASILGFARVRVCKAIRKNGAGAKTRVMGKDLVMGYTNPAGLNGDRISYVPNGAIDTETPSFGYTYVYENNPLMYNPYRDEERSATCYKLDFDRQVINTGVDRTSGLITHGYLIKNAVA